MKYKAAILCVALSAAGGVSCRKGGGGGGGWLVGTSGLMANIDDNGHLGAGYDLGAAEQLNAIACRYADEAWVVGNAGTVLYTSDGGQSWVSQDLETTANLRALATQDRGPVFVVGDGVFMTAIPSLDTGAAIWTQLGDGATSFRSVSAAQRGTTVLAVDDSGGLWSYATGSLTKVTTLAGARAVAVAPDGRYAIAVGDGIYRSIDGGQTWNSIQVQADLHFDNVRVEANGEAVAVGSAGVVSRIDLEGRVLTQHVGSADLKALHIAPSDGYTGLGYAAGVGGQVWITEDSGWTWKPGPQAAGTVLGIDEIGFGHN